MRDLYLAFRDSDDRVLMKVNNTTVKDMLNVYKALTAVLLTKVDKPVQDIMQEIINKAWDGVHIAMGDKVEANPEDVNSWGPSWLNAVNKEAVDEVVKALNEKLFVKEQEIYELKQEIGRLKNADSNALPQADKKEQANKENIEDFLKEQINERDTRIENLLATINLLNDENSRCKKTIFDLKKEVTKWEVNYNALKNKAQKYYDEKESLEKADYVHMEEINRLNEELGKANRGILRYEQCFLKAAEKLYPGYFVCLKLIPHDKTKPEVHKIAKKE